MVVAEWRIRDYEDPVDEQEAYSKFPNMFSLKIHHGGYFTESPGRKYIQGTHNFIDFIDMDLFSVIEINDMIEKLGYKRKDSVMYYHFKIPNNDLDYGLQALGNDGDVLNLVSWLAGFNCQPNDLTN
ncbi:transposase, MuDR [Artemisia annua]|uniref:Transposase, MuDR n=1 Tax=Artemisia annua TaxID=35608 RepID=A0A2U1MWE8_ARTAN|nr:transposase, MuDR [Artemisia annua]